LEYAVVSGTLFFICVFLFTSTEVAAKLRP